MTDRRPFVAFRAMLDKKSAPGTDANAQRSQPDPERPNDAQPTDPAGKEPDAGKDAGSPAGDAPNGGDTAAAGKATTEATDTTDWKAKYDDAETKRRDIQSKHDRLVNGAKEHEQALANLDTGWRRWIEKNAPDAYAKLTEFEQRRGQQREGERAAQGQSAQVILGVYREGDKAFGDYLSAIAEDGAKITPQSLERHRETFESIRGTRAASSSANGNGSGSEQPKPKGDEPPAPPRMAGGGRPAVTAPPAWDGKTFSPRKYLTEGLEKGDARPDKRRSFAQPR